MVKLRSALKRNVGNTVRWLSSEVEARLRSAAARRAAPLCRIAVISDGLAYSSEQQLYPIRRFKRRLLRNNGLLFRFFHLRQEGAVPRLPLRSFHTVMLKMTYQTSPARADAVVEQVRRRMGDGGRLIYLDGDDDACVQWPDILDRVDSYVKGQAFSARADYGVRWTGKSNLHDYVCRAFGHRLGLSDYGNPGDPEVMIEHSGVVPTDQQDKITVGWNMALAQSILELRQRVAEKGWPQERSLDVSFRGSAKPGTIRYHLRAGVAPILEKLADRYRIAAAGASLPLQDYYDELLNCRIVISPFGFGELCWRDFEVALSGALLIKPDMSHLQTSPDIYRAGQTYVPVRWDFADLAEKCVHYLEHEDERRRIVNAAKATLDDYYDTFAFGRRLSELVRN